MQSPRHDLLHPVAALVAYPSASVVVLAATACVVAVVVQPLVAWVGMTVAAYPQTWVAELDFLASLRAAYQMQAHHLVSFETWTALRP